MRKLFQVFQKKKRSPISI